MTTFRLPYPPSINHYFMERVITPRGGKPRVMKIVGKHGLAFRKAVAASIRERFGRISATDARLQVSIVAVMPDRRSRDIDNVLKATLDSLTQCGVWIDDSQVDDLRVIRGHVEKPGWLEVTVTRMPAVVQRELFGDG